MRVEMPRRRKEYGWEFRDRAVRTIEEVGTPNARVARGLGVVEDILGTLGAPGKVPRGRVVGFVQGRLRRVQAAACWGC